MELEREVWFRVARLDKWYYFAPNTDSDLAVHLALDRLAIVLEEKDESARQRVQLLRIPYCDLFDALS
jgi:hypothetical protein